MENVKLYKFEDCIEGHGTNQRDIHCTHIDFINHPQIRMRQPCQYKLLKTVELLNPLRTIVPYMRHRKMEFDTCEQIVITLSSLV